MAPRDEDSSMIDNASIDLVLSRSHLLGCSFAAPLSPHQDVRKHPLGKQTTSTRSTSTSFLTFAPCPLQHLVKKGDQKKANTSISKLEEDIVKEKSDLQRSSFNTATTQASSICSDDEQSHILAENKQLGSWRFTQDSFRSFESDEDEPFVRSSPKVVLDVVTLTENQKEATTLNREGTRLLRLGKDSAALECFLKSRQAIQCVLVGQRESLPRCPFLGQEINIDQLDVADDKTIHDDEGEEDGEYGFFFEVASSYPSERGLNVKVDENEKTILCNPNDKCGMSVLLLSESLYNIAFVHWRNGKCKKAMESLDKAYETVRETSSTSSMPRRSSALSLLSLTNVMGGGSSDADEDSNEKKPLKFPSTRTRIKYSDSLEKALTNCEIKILKGIGTVHSLMKDYTNAVNSFIQALRLHRRTRLDRDSDSHYDEHELLHGDRDVKEEEANEQKQFDLEMSLIVSMIASVYVKCGEHNGALTMYRDVLNIKKSVLGRRHASLAATYVDIAHVYYHLEMYDVAMEHYLKAAKMQEKLLTRCCDFENNNFEGVDMFTKPLDVAVTWHYIGRVFSQRDDPEDALNVFNQVKQLYRSQGMNDECITMRALLRDMAEASIVFNKQNQERYMEQRQQSLAVMKKMAEESWVMAKKQRNECDVASPIRRPLWRFFFRAYSDTA